MNILHRNSIKSIMLFTAIFICIVFFSYRVLDITLNYDETFHSFSTMDSEMITSLVEENIASYDIGHSLVQMDHQTYTIELSMMLVKYLEDDKGSLLNILVKVAVFFMIHLFFMQLFFLCVIRWLIKMNIITEHNTPLIIYTHKKDGKKKCYPSYVYSC